MGLRDRMRNLFQTRSKSTTSSANNFAKWFNPYNIFARQSHEALANNETIFAAVSRISNTMAVLPLKLHASDHKLITNHNAGDIVTNIPNGNMTAFSFIRLMETHRNTYGNAYAIKEYTNSYKLKALHVLDPSKVEPMLEKESKELWYRVNGDNGYYYVHNMDMLHVTHVHTKNFKGISPLEVLRNTINYDDSVKDFSLQQMENGIKASFILKVAGHLDDKKKKEMLQNFKDFYSSNGGGVILIDAGHDLKEVGHDFIDTKVFEVEKITRNRVAMVYNMPSFMLGDFTTSTGTTEQQMIQFIQSTILAIVRQYEQEFNKKLLTDAERRRGLTFKFNLNGLLRGDTATRGEFYQKGIRNGWFKPNEVRALEELPPAEGGDILFVSGDLYDIRDTNRGTVKDGGSLKGGENSEPGKQTTDPKE